MGQYDEILLVQFVGRYDSEHFSISVHYANKDKILLVLCGKIKKAMELDADATVLSVYELNATMSILRPVL
jgi:Ni,Fe-hydrogenase III small subunit